MTNNKNRIISDLITKPMVAIALAIAATTMAATFACGGGETVVQTVVVEKITTRATSAPNSNRRKASVGTW